MGWGSGQRLNPIVKVTIRALTLVSIIYHTSVVNGHEISKRESALVGLLERHAMSLDTSKFTSDPVIVQTQTTMKYINPKKRSGLDSVLEKKHPEAGKDTIILSSADNKFAIPTPRGGKKRQFVLFKKQPNTLTEHDKLPYYASFVYVRDQLPNDTNPDVFDLNGVKTVAEWDIWDMRTKRFYAGWPNCEFSMMFTCASIKAMAEDAMKNKLSGKSRKTRELSATDNDKHSRVERSASKKVALIPMQSEDGMDPNEYNDLYLDFDFHAFDELFPEENKKADAARRKRNSADANVNVNVGSGQKGGAGLFGNMFTGLGVGAGNNGKSGNKGGFKGIKGKNKGGVSGGGDSGDGGLFAGIGTMFGPGSGFPGGGYPGGGGGGYPIGGSGGSGNRGGGGRNKGGGGPFANLLNAPLDFGGGSGGGGPLSGLTGLLTSPLDIAGGLLGKTKEGGSGAVKVWDDLVKVPMGALGSITGADKGGIGGMIGGVMGGAGSPLAGLGGMANSVLGGNGALGGVLGVAGDIFGGSADALTGLAGGGAGALSGLGLGAGGVFGDAMSALTGGENGPMAMLKPLLGPTSAILDPFLGVFGTANDIVREIPGLAHALGHEILGTAVSGIGDAIGIGALMDSMGMGGILDSVNGIAESILSTGEHLLSAWDTIGNGLIDSAGEILTKMGVPPDFAKLAALGAQLAFNSVSFVGKGFWTLWRAGYEIAGTAVNGGRFRGKGFDGPDSVESNINIIFGTVYGGADNGKEFFFPHGALIRAIFKTSDGSIEGFYEPNVPGQPDAFYPDDDDELNSFIDTRGRMIPDGFKGKDAEAGIVGTLEPGYKFIPEGMCMKGIYDTKNPEMKEKVWLPPGAETKIASRPDKTPEGKTILYGYLLQGIDESPHIFISEGDSLTGFFVPGDPDNTHITETPHGTLTPTHPAGHAVFVAENPKEIEHVKEVKGVFMPDAMNLAGGVSGRISKCDDGAGKYSFVLDRPAIEFMYIPDTPEVDNVWNVYLSDEEWKHIPPPIPPAPPLPRKEQPGKKTGLLGVNVGGKDENGEAKPLVGVDLGGEPKKEEDPEEFGIKVTTKKTTAFLPENLAIEGALVPVDKNVKYNPVLAKITVKKQDAPLKVEITNKGQGNPAISAPVVAIFVPQHFPKEDAIFGALTLDASQDGGELKLAQPSQSHFWTRDQEMWLPAEFATKVNVSVGATVKVKRNAKGGAEVSVPGVASGPVDAPDKPPNYKFGRLHEETDEMEENVVETMPHGYSSGFYYKDPDSSEPVFIPEDGVVGTLTPDGGEPHKGYYFPEKKGIPSDFILDEPDKVPEGTSGKFHTLDIKDKPSKGFIKVTLKDSLELSSDTEILSAWEQSEAKPIILEELPKGHEKDIPPEHLEPKKRPLRYALVDIGGGFKGVIMEGAESLDDANNPIFQEYLHYRAQHDGDVNPWGHVAIIDPISRTAPETPPPKPQKGNKKYSVDGIFGGIFKLGLGLVANFVGAFTGIFANMMGGFSLNNWEYPQVSEMQNHVEIHAMKLGERGNIANMMDFRMFIYKKFACKRANIDGVTVRLFTPLSSERFLKVKVHAKPKKQYLDQIHAAGESMIIPKQEGIVGQFSAEFELDPNFVAPFQRPAGTGAPDMNAKRDTNDWKTTEPFDEFGDEHSCDEIELDQLQAAQAIATMQGDNPVTGMDIGMQLTAPVGNKVKYTEAAGKLLANIDRKQAEQKEKTATGQTSTDLLGGINSAVENTAGGLINVAEGSSPNSKGKLQAKMKGRSLMDDSDDSRHAKSLPGWKTQFRIMMPNTTLVDDGLIFYGLGNCEQNGVPDLALLNSGKATNVIKYYLQVLRIDCMEQAKDRIVDLFNTGFLSLSDSGMHFDIPANNPEINTLRLTPAGIKRISLAFEFHAFTEIYDRLRNKQGYQTSGILVEPHCNISRSTGFLTEWAHLILTKARRVSPSHSVRLTRNLLSTLRTTLTKLHQDSIRLNECSTCEFDKMLTAGDKFRLTSLIQFIIHGLGPFERGNKPVKSTFTNFVKINKEAITQRVTEFERQFPSPAKP